MRYVSIFEAMEELKKRQEDGKLIERVNQFLDEKECPIPPGKNYGFLFRHLATSRLEDMLFAVRCLNVGLEPCTLVYPEDIFVTINPSKVRLGRLSFILSQNHGNLFRIKIVNDFKNWEKLPISKIVTKWGESLVDFHHRTRKMVGKEFGINFGEIMDLSTWFKKIGKAKDYYPILFALVTTRGILFESFESPGFPTLDVFKNEVVVPAWEWIKNNFGIFPLIVRHPDVISPEIEEVILNCYPSVVIQSLPPMMMRKIPPSIVRYAQEKGMRKILLK